MSKAKFTRFIDFASEAKQEKKERKSTRFIDYAAGGRKKYYMVEEISPSPRRGDEQC